VHGDAFDTKTSTCCQWNLNARTQRIPVSDAKPGWNSAVPSDPTTAGDVRRDLAHLDIVVVDGTHNGAQTSQVQRHLRIKVPIQPNVGLSGLYPIPPPRYPLAGSNHIHQTLRLNGAILKRRRNVDNVSAWGIDNNGWGRRGFG